MRPFVPWRMLLGAADGETCTVNVKALLEAIKIARLDESREAGR